MQIKKNLVLLLFLIGKIVPLTATSHELSLQDAIKLSLQKDAHAKKATIDLQKANLSIATMWNSFIPNASLSGSTGISQRRNLDNPSYTTSSSLSSSADLSFSVHPDLFIKLYENSRNYSYSKTDYNDTLKKLTYETTLNYYNLAVQKEELNLKNIATQTQLQRYADAKKLYQSSEIGEIELLRREYNWRTAQHQYNEIQQKLQKNMTVFLHKLGLSEITTPNDIVLTDKLPIIKDTTLNAIIELQPEQARSWKSLQRLLENAKLKELYASTSYIPSIGLGSSLNLSHIGNIHESPSNFNLNSFSYSHSLRLSLSIPINNYFPFSKAQTKSIEMMLERKKIEISLNEEKQLLTTTIESLKDELDFMIKTYENAEFNAQIAEKVANLTLKAYHEGTKTFTELNDAEADHNNARLKMMQNKLSLLTTILNLEYDYDFILLDKGVSL